MKIYMAYFSATNTTRKIVDSVARFLSTDVRGFNLTNGPLREQVLVGPDEVLLVGLPVYAGRVPVPVLDSLKQFKGDHTPVILVGVYGNRAYDDMFVELQDLFEDRGFFVMGAAAFIAQHSLFPHAAKGRPDASDMKIVEEFASQCKFLLEKGFKKDEKSVALPGKRPYKVPGSIPLVIRTSGKCTGCGTCIKACPVGAISPSDPHVTDYDRCIHCARCVNICPEHARHFGGKMYYLASLKFAWKYHERKEPELFF